MVALLALVACGGASPAPESPAATTTLVVAGSSTVQPAVELAARAFEAAHPGVKVDVQGGGSAVGVSSARSGLAQVGMVSRALKDDERDLVATPIGFDALAIVAHRDNAVSDVTKQQVADVYAGAVASWKALGGADRPVAVVTEAEGRAAYELFVKHFGLEGRIRGDARVVASGEEAVAAVEGDPDAVAYVPLGPALREAGLKRLSLDGRPATAEAARDGTWPLSRELDLVTNGAPSGPAKGFVDFVLSPEGQALVEQAGFVPLR